MGRSYVWLVRVYDRGVYRLGSGMHYNLLSQKVFTSKVSAINYQIDMENKGYVTKLVKYFG